MLLIHFTSCFIILGERDMQMKCMHSYL